MHMSWYNNWPCGVRLYMPHVPHALGPLGIRDLFLDRLKNHHMGTPENLLYEIPPDPHPVRCRIPFPTNAHNPETKHNFIVNKYDYYYIL